MKLNRKMKKWLNTTGKVELFIESAYLKKTKHTTLLILECTTEDENGEVLYYNKEFSLSQEGQPHLVKFIEDAELLSDKQIDSFKPEYLMGKSFVTEFFQKENKKFPEESKNEFYMVERTDKISPTK